jgi:hypothetical protein
MRFTEIESRLKMTKLHYFNVDDVQFASELGMKQDRNGRWYLPQYNTSGRGFDAKVSSAMRVFGPPLKTIALD